MPSYTITSVPVSLDLTTLLHRVSIEGIRPDYHFFRLGVPIPYRIPPPDRLR